MPEQPKVIRRRIRSWKPGATPGEPGKEEGPGQTKAPAAPTTEAGAEEAEEPEAPAPESGRAPVR